MVNWSKRPEFAIPLWRKRLDIAILCVGVPLAMYQIVYVGLGLYYKQFDHDKERANLRELDDKINRFIFGKSVSEMSSLNQNLHKSMSLIELAAQLRDEQQQQQQNEKTAVTNE